ncbi:hypothetical protein OAW28_02755 [Alphaproteobacteria bacterium]|nr:hypothetical protein [Alphaproteobacteria bacterium]
MSHKRTVFLHGSLASFGGPFVLYANTAEQCISALATQIDGFSAAIADIRLQILTGRKDVAMALDGVGCFNKLLRKHLHVTPAASGAGIGSKSLLGLALLGMSFVPGANTVMASQFAAAGTSIGGSQLGLMAGKFGASLLGNAGGLLLMNGASQALAPQENSSAGTSLSNIVSSQSSTVEGQVVSVIYGQVRCDASLVISSGLTVETQKI